MVRIGIVKRDPLAFIPVAQTDGSAGYDLKSVEKVAIPPGECQLVDTGIAIEIPMGYAGFILPRSGLCLKKGLTVLNSPGLIDSDYRGTIKVMLHNVTDKGKEVAASDRIAQLVVMKVERIGWLTVGELSETERGEGGFGSTDKEDDNADEE